MKQLASLTWKEWRETRGLLMVALFVFVGLPAIGGIEDMLGTAGRFHLFTIPWITLLGGVLAVLIAVSETCRDFTGHLEDFWASRPFGEVRWLGIKYLVGLLATLAACTIPLYLDYQIDRDDDALALLKWMPFAWTAIYSLAFLVGCLVRRTAHAAMLGLAAMLMVYFLPLVLPPLHFLAIDDPFASNVAHGSGAALLALSAAAVLAAIFSVHQGWRIQTGQRGMYGAITATLLLLFSTVAFQAGNNLPVIQQVDLPPGQEGANIRGNSMAGFVGTQDKWDPHSIRQLDQYVQTFEVTPSGLQLGPARKADPNWNSWLLENMIGDPSHPETGYMLESYFPGATSDHPEKHIILWIAHFDLGTFDSLALPWAYDPNDTQRPWPNLYAWQGRVYIFGDRLLVLDATGATLRIISDTPFNYGGSFWPGIFESNSLIPNKRLDISLPLIPDLAPPQRIAAAVRYRIFDGQNLCAQGNSGHSSILLQYRLTELTDTRAAFELVGQREEPLLENFFGSYGYGMKLVNGLLYVSNAYGGNGLFNPHFSVYDTRGPEPLRLLGHFAAPGARTLYPLPDGRAVVVGYKLYLIGKPARADDQ